VTRLASGLAIAALVSLWGEPAPADPAPQPPCGNEVSPAYPEVEQPPVAKVWEHGELGRTWHPPQCTGWEDAGFSTLVVIAARFHYTGGRDDLLSRIGAISMYKGVQYWSTTHQQWRTLIVDAAGKTAESGDQRRDDFLPGELAAGHIMFFEQTDSLSGKGIYQMRVLSASADRIVFDTRNVSTMRIFMLPIFHPGELQSIYFLEHESKDVWRYYNITRTGKNASSLIAGHGASSINRAVAFYRHIAGIPTDKEPPAAR
jgi:hypothetical protein